MSWREDISTGGGENSTVQRGNGVQNHGDGQGCVGEGLDVWGDWNIGHCEERLYIDEFGELGLSYSEYCIMLIRMV